MAKHTAETLAAICDRLVAHPHLKPAARSIGIDPSTLFAWLQKSRADPASLSFPRAYPFWRYWSHGPVIHFCEPQLSPLWTQQRENELTWLAWRRR